MSGVNEPAKAPINICYTIQTKIKRIWQHHEQVYRSGFGPDTVFAEVDGGYYVAFEGSYEALYFGMTPPAGWKVGDVINITFSKAPNA